VGYGTFYGDLIGAFAPLGDLWKHEVFELARYINKYIKPIIPEQCLLIKPSAELSAQQNINLGLGDPMNYDYHDDLFKLFFESTHPLSPEEIIALYKNKKIKKYLSKVDVYKLFPKQELFVQDLMHWWQAYRGLAVAKRIQAPPIIACSETVFGFDYRESLVR
jgi:NAD+ synthase (glutamine-hydrolysing)